MIVATIERSKKLYELSFVTLQRAWSIWQSNCQTQHIVLRVYYSVTAIYWHKFKCVCTAHFIKYNRKIGNNLVFIVAFYLNKWFFFASMLRFIKQFVMGRAEDCTSRFCQLAKASKISIGHKCMGVCTDNQRMGDSKFAFLPR